MVIKHQHIKVSNKLKVELHVECLHINHGYTSRYASYTVTSSSAETVRTLAPRAVGWISVSAVVAANTWLNTSARVCGDTVVCQT